MPDFGGINVVAPAGQYLLANSHQKKPDVPAIEKSEMGSSGSDYGHNRSRDLARSKPNDNQADLSQSKSTLLKPDANGPHTRVLTNLNPPDPEPLTGPSPAFQSSLLEVEANLKHVIRQIEAARDKAQSDMAIKPAPAKITLTELEIEATTSEA
jgi:hypothetical protein